MKHKKNIIALIGLLLLIIFNLAIFSGSGNPIAGKNIFSMKACVACHAVSIDNKASLAALGPYLKNISSKRDDTWLKSYLKNPMEVFQKDLSLQQNAGKYAARMPNLPLSDVEIDHLIAYLKSL